MKSTQKALPFEVNICMFIVRFTGLNVNKTIHIWII